MSRKRKKTKRLIIDNEEMDVTFYSTLTSKQIEDFLYDVETYYEEIRDEANIFEQQFIHSLLVIKHFTSYEMPSGSLDDLLKEGTKFTKAENIEQFSNNFDTTLIRDINQIVVMHFLAEGKDVPEYLNYGLNKQMIRQLKKDMELYGETVNDILSDIEANGYSSSNDEDWEFEEEEEIEKPKIVKEKEDDDEDSSYFYLGPELGYIKIVKADYLGDIFKQQEKKSPKKSKQKQSSKEVKNELSKSIDALLDEHNDYLRLYNQFGDEEYRTRAENILQVLKGEKKYEEI